MATLEELMPTLRDQKIKGLFVSEYLATNEVINSWVFADQAIPNGATGFQHTIVRDETTVQLEGRSFGENYKIVEGTFIPESYHLHPHGGAFEVDSTQNELSGGVILENKSRSMMRLAAELAVDRFINGDGVTQVLGLNAAVTKYDQVYEKGIDFTSFIENPTIEGANKILAELRLAKVKATNGLNRAYVSSTIFAAMSTVMSLTNQANRIVDNNGVLSINYDGLLWLRIDDAIMSKGLKYTVDEGGTPTEYDSTDAIYLARMDIEAGIYIAVPQNGELVRYKEPVPSGNALDTGMCEFVFAPVYKNRKAIVGIPVY